MLYNIYGGSMKKVFAIILFFMCITLVNAEERFKVEFSNCVDGDTAKFIYNNEEITARFLAIDTPETVHPTKEVEAYGKDASNYTCTSLKEAKEIVLEYDNDSDKKDKYDRYLVWVFVDGELLQEKLISKGLASVAYLYGDYKYTDILEEAEQTAEENKLGIWSDENNINEDSNSEEKETTDEDNDLNDKNLSNIESFIEKYKEYIILIGALILVSIFNLKSKSKVKTKLKNKIKSDIKKRLK